MWRIALLCASCLEYRPRGGRPPVAPPPGSVLDTFVGAEPASVDVLVFTDTSPSMDLELVTLGTKVRPFLDRLAARVADWQLAAVTGNTGCTVGGTLTPETPGYADLFALSIATPVGTPAGREMGLQNVAVVLEGWCSPARDGVLEVLFVSDENDESPGFADEDGYWADYVRRMGAALGDPTRLKLSAVAGPVPDGCLGADAGDGYDGAVAATGGAFLSICGDWPTQVEVLADTLGLRTSFPLSEWPREGSIEVWRDEAPEPAFRWDEPSDAVVLEAPLLPASVLTVLYERG